MVEFHRKSFIFLLLFFLSLSCVNGEEPISVCGVENPFRLSDNKCSNFTDVCIKKDDLQCKQLQSACKECPASNMTEIMLEEILKVANYRLDYFLKAILIFNIAIVLLLVLENRFKLISKLCFSIIKTKNNSYQLIHSRKGKIEFSNFIGDSGTKLKFRLPTENKVIELHVYGNDNVVNIKKHICKKWPKAQSDSYKIMKLIYKGKYLDDNQNIISLIGSHKGEILCEMDYSVNASDILVLRVAGIRRDTELVQINKGKNISDLNQILCKLFNCEGISMFVKPFKNEKYSPLKDFYMTLEAAKLCDNSRIVVVKEKPMRIKFQSILNDEDPFVIELSRTESVSAVLTELKQKFKSENFVLILNNCNMESDKFLFQYNIDEETKITYCRFYEMEGRRPFSISDMFKKQGLLKKEQEMGSIIIKDAAFMDHIDDKMKDYEKTDQQKDQDGMDKETKNKEKDQDWKNLEEKDRDEYDQTEKHKNVFDQEGKDQERDDKFSELEKATYNITKREVALMEYKLSDWTAFKNSSGLIKELRKLETANANERFVQIFGLYKGAESVFVLMELMAMSMKERFATIDGKVKIASNEQVIKWSRQILEGLACLHDNGIAYDELTMSNILLNNKGDIKLATINIDTAIHGLKFDDINRMYLAPEIRNGKPWNIKADVWSFGMILLEIITGKCFNFNAIKNENKNDADFFKIDYSKYVFPEGINESFKGVIDSCLVEDPNGRISVQMLLSIDLLISP